mmetsp:Transcript_31424/g.92132  ORF Transcript_31424/g.92132 Transcript_31424/m.92132 type:complete len:112 (+) Transcript_31424:131-466(+)
MSRYLDGDGASRRRLADAGTRCFVMLLSRQRLAKCVPLDPVLDPIAGRVPPVRCSWYHTNSAPPSTELLMGRRVSMMARIQNVGLEGVVVLPIVEVYIEITDRRQRCSIAT